MPTPIGLSTLLQDLIDRIAALAAGQTWRTEAGAAVALACYRYSLPNTALDQGGPGPFPYLIARPIGGSQGTAEGRFQVRLAAGLHHPGEAGEGDEDIERLAAVILKLPLDQEFSPFALDITAVELQFGAKGDDLQLGRQPHPEYYLTADLWFNREAVYF